MPYIDPAGRVRAWIAPEGAGPLCYALSKQVNDYRLRQGDSFATFAEILAALEATKLEFYARYLRPFEDDAIRRNGDIWDACPTERNLAWAAGFFEGEGCFFASYYRSGRYRTHASVAQKDSVLLAHFQHIVGFGVVYPNKPDCSVWKTTKVGEAAKLLEWFRPWLSERRLQKAEGLLTQEQLQEFRPISSSCKNGHVYGPEDMHRGRRCKICAKEYARLWRVKQPAGYWKKYI